jgi:glutaredoxin 3
MPLVTTHTKSSCGYCTRAITLLARKGAAFDEVEISHDPAPRDDIVAPAGGRCSASQIIIGEARVGGCDDL